jgi:hypothetical protein
MYICLFFVQRLGTPMFQFHFESITHSVGLLEWWIYPPQSLHLQTITTLYKEVEEYFEFDSNP